jgi:hypothetical protein
MCQCFLWLRKLLAVEVALLLRLAYFQFHLRNLLLQDLQILHELLAEGLVLHVWHLRRLLWFSLSNNVWSIWRLVSTRRFLRFLLREIHRLRGRSLCWFQVRSIWSLTPNLACGCLAWYFGFGDLVNHIVTICPTTTSWSSSFFSAHDSWYMLLFPRSCLIGAATPTPCLNECLSKLLADFAWWYLFSQWVRYEFGQLVRSIQLNSLLLFCWASIRLLL